MCLSKVGTRTQGETGIAYKTYFRLKEDGSLLSMVREEPALADCWMLNSEPTKDCNCGDKNRYDLLTYSLFYPSSKFKKTEDATEKEFEYEHGFHLYKNKIKALKNIQVGDFKEAIEAGLVEVVLKAVSWKGYIAEDDEQIVSRQIFVPDVATPTDVSITYDIIKKSYV